MRCVPAGNFTQGSPSTEPCRNDDEAQFIHILTRNLAVMETEINRQMWMDLKAAQATLPVDPSNTTYSPTMSHPIQQSTWHEAVLFSNLLSLHNGFTRCYYTDSGFTIPITSSNDQNVYCDFDADGYRLPSEGEWEYFTRAGTTGPYSSTELNYSGATCKNCDTTELTVLNSIAWWCGNSEGITHPVGSKAPNPWNLKDLHGNVEEWCWDGNGSYPVNDSTDYTGPTNSSERMFRGGCWNRTAYYSRSAIRQRVAPFYRVDVIGFRLVRLADLQPPPTTMTPLPTNTPANTLTSTPTIFTPTATETQTPTNTPTNTPIIVSVGNMISISAGTFTQGSPATEPCRDEINEIQFTHNLTRNLLVMENEVSRQMWSELSFVQPSLPVDPSDATISPTGNHPVQQTTWYESLLFSNLLSNQYGFTRCYYTNSSFTIPIDVMNYTTGPFFCNFDANGFRLPSEGEWEYLTRAGTIGPFSCEEANFTSPGCYSGGSCAPWLYPTLVQYCVYCGHTCGGPPIVAPWSVVN